MERFVWWALGLGVFAVTLIGGLNNLGTGNAEVGGELVETAPGDPALTDAQRVSFFNPELHNGLGAEDSKEAVPTDTPNSNTRDDGQIANVGEDLHPDESVSETGSAVRNVGDNLHPDEPLKWADTAVRNVGQDLDPDVPMNWVETEVRNVGDPGREIDALAVSTSVQNGFTGIVNTGDPDRMPEE